MSVILVDNKNEQHELQLSNWSWQPIVELLKASGSIIDKERLDMMKAKLTVEISQAEAQGIADCLEQVVNKLESEQVIKQDGSVTGAHNAITSLKDLSAKEWDDLYTVGPGTLQSLLEFCRSCNGFKNF